jgi:hypothetical protein
LCALGSTNRQQYTGVVAIVIVLCVIESVYMSYAISQFCSATGLCTGGAQALDPGSNPHIHSDGVLEQIANTHPNTDFDSVMKVQDEVGEVR